VSSFAEKYPKIKYPIFDRPLYLGMYMYLFGKYISNYRMDRIGKS
jgi:hypothetical protein